MWPNTGGGLGLGRAMVWPVANVDCSRLAQRRAALRIQANGSRRTADTETLTPAVEWCLRDFGPQRGEKQPGCHRLAGPADVGTVAAGYGRPSGFAESLQHLDMCWVSVLTGAGSRTATRWLPPRLVDLECRRMR